LMAIALILMSLVDGDDDGLSLYGVKRGILVIPAYQEI